MSQNFECFISEYDFFARKDNFANIKSIDSIKIFGEISSIPKVTIAIPTCNRVRTLKDALQSALNQNYFDDYCIIVLDDSGKRNDETEQFMDSYRSTPKVSYFKNSKNLGMAGNFNRLFELAETEFVILLHDDDILSPAYLNKIFPFALSNKADIVSVDKITWEESKCERPQFRNYKKTTFIKMKPAHMFNLCRCIPSGLLIRKSVVVNEGGFDGNLHPSIDYVFLTKSFFKYRAFRYKEPLLIYRWAENVSIKLETQRLLIYNDHYFKKDFGKKMNYPQWFIDFVCKKDALIRYKRIIEDFGEQEIYLEGKQLTYPTIPQRVLYKIYDMLDNFKYRKGL